MSHNRSDSLESTTSTMSTLTTISSSSVDLYKERLKPFIKAVGERRTLQELVDDAEKIIKEKFTPDSRSTFKYKKDREVSVQLDQVMLSMLACAEECGGESGKRYVASAICACSMQEDVVGALEALGTTWLTHLLFIFKTGRGNTDQLDSGFSTPTIDDTANCIFEGVGKREKSFRNDVMRRDGYACVVTGYHDYSHPEPDPTTPEVELVAAHILRRAVCEYDSNENSESFKSAATTFDILVNFTRLPMQTLQELNEQLDNPSNGMALQKDAHDAYDKFRWCLKPTETEHVYDLKIFKRNTILHVLPKPADNRVSFKDYSNDFFTVPLPNPHHIAIHAAIAEILNMSGAGKFFDELLDQFRDDEGNVPALRSWSDLGKFMEEQLMRESILKVFQ